MSFTSADIVAARRHLSRVDPVMRRLIATVGPFTLKLERHRFLMLVRSIISQQISVAAARSIRRRLDEAVRPGRLTAVKLAALSIDELRAAGLSPQKAGYLNDLARRVVDGSVRLNRLTAMDDEAAIAELVQIRGIGRWTAQMLLIFCLGRLDILPVDDFGLRKAVMQLYALPSMSSPSQVAEIAAPWQPYSSVATWYCWRSLDLPKPVKATATPQRAK